jgi:hypothetical protein
VVDIEISAVVAAAGGFLKGVSVEKYALYTFQIGCIYL